MILCEINKKGQHKNVFKNMLSQKQQRCFLILLSLTEHKLCCFNTAVFKMNRTSQYTVQHNEQKYI